MLEPFKIKILIPFTIIFHETLHSYNNLCPSNEGVSKGCKHSLIYTNQRETKQEIT